jgi:CheY-like chemotaxis protein
MLSTIQGWPNTVIDVPVPPRPRYRLLVAEDAQCIQMKVGCLLQKIGVDFEMAINGQIACEMAEKSKAEGKPYDMILMDIQMPVLNGEDATRRLRQDGWKGPIVAISARAENSDGDQFIKAGCDGYTGKPVTEENLRNVIEKYLPVQTDQAIRSNVNSPLR